MNASGIGGYLRHVDGLRGISVLLVVFYHAWPETVPGGFIGVDVFFVISGFLITRLLLAEQVAGKLSYRQFLMRRVRRLWPSFALVLAVTLGLGWLLLEPKALADLGRTALSAIGFSSNWYFAFTTDYFNEGLSRNLLLHTWSLAVEEQFYLVYPLVLVLAVKFRRGVLLTLGALWGLSFAGVLFFGATSEAFFQTHLRVWELASGALLFCLLESGAGRKVPEAYRSWMGGLGVLIVLLAAFLMPRSLWWPSALALVPVAGAVLCIAFPWRMLEARWLVGIGLISYALYLWHWPLLQVLQTLTPRPADGVILATVLLSVCLAWLAWRYVEEPIRRGRALGTSKALLGVAGLASLILGWVGWQYHAKNGFPDRFSAELAVIAATESDNRTALVTCQDGLSPLAEMFNLPVLPDLEIAGGGHVNICVASARKMQAPRILYVGDSHLGAISREIADRAGARDGPGIVFVTLAACSPVPGVFREEGGLAGARQCQRVKEQMMAVLATGQIEKIVLVAHWDIYGGDTPEKYAEYGAHFIRFAQAVVGQAELHVVLDVPTHDFDVTEALIRYTKWPWLGVPDWTTRERHEQRRAPYLEVMQEAARNGQVILHDPVPSFCPEADCRVQSGVRVLYNDGSHITQAGAAFLMDALPDLPY